jgi:hypothetical protein
MRRLFSVDFAFFLCNPSNSKHGTRITLMGRIKADKEKKIRFDPLNLAQSAFYLRLVCSNLELLLRVKRTSRSREALVKRSLPILITNQQQFQTSAMWSIGNQPIL